MIIPELQHRPPAPAADRIRVRDALERDVGIVSDILREAADWLRNRGVPLWTEEELTPARLAPDVAAGQFFLAEWDGEAAGTLRFQLSDPEVWPDLDFGDSAFIHRFAVRRSLAGQGVSLAMLSWAAARARDCGRSYLRLDCEANRPRLRAFYEGAGFSYHSDFRVGRFYVARYERQLIMNDDR